MAKTVFTAAKKVAYGFWRGSLQTRYPKDLPWKILSLENRCLAIPIKDLPLLKVGTIPIPILYGDYSLAMDIAFAENGNTNKQILYDKLIW